MAGNTTEWEFTGNSKILKKAIEDAITVFKGLDTQSKGTTAALGKLEGQLDDLTDTSKSSGKALDKVRDKFQNIGDTGGDVDSIL